MNHPVGSKKRTFINFISLSILQIGNYVLPMITLPIISRIIGPENYGAINYAFAFVGYFILFINAGFDLYGARQIISFKGDKQKIEDLFSRITFAKIFILGLTTIAFVICLFTIEQLRSELLISVFTYLLCLGWVINPSWLYNGMQDSRRYAIFSFVSKLLFSIAVILVVTERSDYIYHPLITSIAHVLVSFVSFYYALRKYKLRLHVATWSGIKQTLKENRTLWVTWWINNQFSSTGIVIAGFLLATADVGFYSAAIRMIIIIQSIISMPLNTVLFPYIGEAFVQGNAAGMKRINKSFPYLFIISIMMAVGTFFISKPLILLFFGTEFTDAIFLLKVLALALFFATINSAFGQQVMLNMKKDGVYIRFITVSFFLNIAFLLFFINMYGTIGAAIAWPAAEILVFLGYLVYFRNKGIRVFDFAYYKPAYIVGNTMKLFNNKIKNKPAL